MFPTVNLVEYKTTDSMDMSMATKCYTYLAAILQEKKREKAKK